MADGAAKLQVAAVLGVGISVVAVLFSALFNKFSDQLSPFIDMIPPGMKAVVGDLAIGTTPEGWLSIELFPLVAMVGVVITGDYFGRWGNWPRKKIRARWSCCLLVGGLA